MKSNPTMFQAFHWYLPNDGNYWSDLALKASWFKEVGITSVWLPPAFKCNSGKNSVGYDVYDLYDLGEFDQKGTIETKYGSKDDYVKAVKTLRENGIQIYVDIVLNHKAGADEVETVEAIPLNPDNRLEEIEPSKTIEAYTKFTFPGRQGKYSQFVWDKSCFTGVDFNKQNNETGIFSIKNEYGDGWEEMVDDEKGNYDYLMYADIEFRNEAVRTELKNWGKWYFDLLQFDGVRLDAVKHISPQFYIEWLDYMRLNCKEQLFAVGEYWAPGKLDSLLKYTETTDGRMMLFDSSLHYNLHLASNSGSDFDMRTIFNDTLTLLQPHLSVTVVDNHDTQPLQALEATVEPWFKPLAYALILLRLDGYPCVFYPDVFGAQYTDKGIEINLPPCANINELMKARKLYAYGDQSDYLDHPNCIAWVRAGITEMPNSGCVVILCNGDAGYKDILAGKHFANMEMIDVLGNVSSSVMVNYDGYGKFVCNAGSVSVWVAKNDQNT